MSVSFKTCATAPLASDLVRYLCAIAGRHAKRAAEHRLPRVLWRTREAVARQGDHGVHQNGNLVGVVSAKLNPLMLMLATNGDIAQSVNFALKASIVASFREAPYLWTSGGMASWQKMSRRFSRSGSRHDADRGRGGTPIDLINY